MILLYHNIVFAGLIVELCYKCWRF